MKTRSLLAAILTATLFSADQVRAQTPPPPTLTDIKMLAKGGVGEDVILSQVRNSHAIYHLTTADILDLKSSGVSEKVIDFMINTANNSPAPAPPAVAPGPPPVASWPPPPPPTVTQEAVVGSEPPAPIVEQVVVSPGPGYVWIAGYWTWRHGHWEWMRGYWVLPPRREAIWVGGHWEHHGYHVVWVEGYWR